MIWIYKTIRGKMMNKKIEAGTVLYCDYLHLNSAELHRKWYKTEKNGKRVEYKEWKVQSKHRTVLILFEIEEKYDYCSYCILKVTTHPTSGRNNYVCLGQLFGRTDVSYARRHPETYPDNLLDQDSKTCEINPHILSDITHCMSLSKIGCPLNSL